MRNNLLKLSRYGIVNDPYIFPALYKHQFIKRSGAQIAFDGLIKNKVSDVFMYSGGSIMPLIDKFYKNKINYYINTHEQNCGHAATGYAKSSNKPGVVITTSGPGITNMITPMLDAQNDSTPLVVLSGQVGLNNMGTDAFQEAPAVEVSKSVTKWSYCVQSADEIEEAIDEAFRISQEGKKGVVHLDLPKCVLTSEETHNEKKIDSNKKNYLTKSLLNDYKFVEQKYHNHNSNFTDSWDRKHVSFVINNSKKPVIYIGQGCYGAEKELMEFATKNNIPVTSTIHGKGIFPENHRLSLKWCGMHGSAAANYIIQESDCIIAIGSRFDDRTTGNTEFYAPEAQKKKQIIHVDIEKRQFCKSINSNYNVNCDSKYFLENILEHINCNNRKKWNMRVNEVREFNPFKYRIPSENKINTPQVISSINDYLTKYNPEKHHISTGVGNHQMMTYQFIDGLLPKRIHSSGSLGVMGAGLPYAIGIQIANPNSLVIDIDGDSSFMMTLSDLKTIKEYNLPVKVAIMNDHRQMMVNIWERLFFEERYTATINNNNPDFCSLAESFGIKSFTCSSKDNLEEITHEFLSYEGAALCNFEVVEEICLPLVGPGKALDDMIMFDDYHNLDSNDKIKNTKLMKFNKSDVPS